MYRCALASGYLCLHVSVCVYIVLHGNLSHRDVHVLLTQHPEVEVLSMYVTSRVLLFVIKIELVLASEFHFAFCFFFCFFYLS